MGTGHIRIHRMIEDWEWADDCVMFYFWVRILIMANWEDKTWRGELIERGSFVTSLSSLASRLRLSVQQVRTCIERLKSSNQIVVNSTNKRTKITICKYDDYQPRPISEQQTNNKQKNKRITTTKEEYETTDTNVSLFPILEEEKKEERDTTVSPKKPQIDFGYIKRLWNESMTRKVPKVQAISESRKEKIRLRIEEMGGIEQADAILTESFRKINDSEFCNGENDHQWVASFDWFFMNGQNWLKVYEGNYGNKRQVSRLEKSIDIAERAKGLKYLINGTGNEGTDYGFADTPDEQ